MSEQKKLCSCYKFKIEPDSWAMVHCINTKLCSLKRISQLEVQNRHSKRRESRNQQAGDKPYPGIILLPMWKSSLFDIYHPLKNYQASATKRSLKHPTNRDTNYVFNKRNYSCIDIFHITRTLFTCSLMLINFNVISSNDRAKLICAKCSFWC